jgi:Holliday junction DNA helicase RuvA
MIEFISGSLVQKNPTHVIVENNGIGFDLNISIQTFQRLPQVGDQLKLQTYLHVREDNMQLFAFATEDERQVFVSLISVSGVGPRLAQTILSGIRTEELVRSIQDEDLDSLVSISGVGKKTAQRLIVELKEKFMQLGLIEQKEDEVQMQLRPTQTEEEAVLALVSLGYKRPTVEKALSRVRQNGSPESVEEMIKQVLRII